MQTNGLFRLVSQRLAGPNFNDEAVWTSPKPVAETDVTNQKSLGLSVSLKENMRLPTHCNFCGHVVILCRCAGLWLPPKKCVFPNRK